MELGRLITIHSTHIIIHRQLIAVNQAISSDSLLGTTKHAELRAT